MFKAFNSPVVSLQSRTYCIF